MSSAAEHPELQTRPCPEGKEQPCNELADVRRDVEILFQPKDNTKVYKVVQPHEQDKLYNLICCLALASFFAEHPVFVEYEKQDVRYDARNSNSKPRLAVEYVIGNSVPKICRPKQDISSKL